MDHDQYGKYRQHYSDSAFQEKLAGIGGTVREHALLLYLLLKDPRTPAWVIILVIAVLGYLIWPMDVVPDVVPLVGYTDDLAAMASVLVTLENFITPEMRQKARE